MAASLPVTAVSLGIPHINHCTHLDSAALRRPQHWMHSAIERKDLTLPPSACTASTLRSRPAKRRPRRICGRWRVRGVGHLV